MVSVPKRQAIPIYLGSGDFVTFQTSIWIGCSWISKWEWVTKKLSFFSCRLALYHFLFVLLFVDQKLTTLQASRATASLRLVVGQPFCSPELVEDNCWFMAQKVRVCILKFVVMHSSYLLYFEWVLMYLECKYSLAFLFPQGKLFDWSWQWGFGHTFCVPIRISSWILAIFSN